jgi:hypothetical protein
VYFVDFYFVKLPGQNLIVIVMGPEGSMPHLQKSTAEAYPEQNESSHSLSQYFRKVWHRRLHLIKRWVAHRPGVWT